MAESSINRRDFLEKGAKISAGCLLLGAMASCNVEPEKVMGTIGELNTAGYLTVRFNGSKAHACYLDGELVVMSLICRHKKCTVKWEEAEQAFYCPCHEGTYDKEGNVLSGPPKEPLRRFRHEVRGDTIVVLNEFIAQGTE